MGSSSILVSQTLKIIEKEMYTSCIFLSRIEWQHYLLYYVLFYMCGLLYCMYVKVHLKLSHITSQLKDFKEFCEGPKLSHRACTLALSHHPVQYYDFKKNYFYFWLLSHPWQSSGGTCRLLPAVSERHVVLGIEPRPPYIKMQPV